VPNVSFGIHFVGKGRIAANVVFLEKLPVGIIGYTINGVAVKDSWEKIRVYFNGTGIAKTMQLESKNWNLFACNNKISTEPGNLNSLDLLPYSCTILYF